MWDCCLDVGLKLIEHHLGEDLPGNHKEGHDPMIVKDEPVSFSLVKVDNGSMLKFLGDIFLMPKSLEKLGKLSNKLWTSCCIDLSRYQVRAGCVLARQRAYGLFYFQDARGFSKRIVNRNLIKPHNYFLTNFRGGVKHIVKILSPVPVFVCKASYSICAKKWRESRRMEAIYCLERSVKVHVTVYRGLDFVCLAAELDVLQVLLVPSSLRCQVKPNLFL